jgi:hypothetical protein
MDIQQRLDQWLADNPEAQKYVTKLYYVPAGTAAPADATHQVRVSSVQSVERALTIAMVVVPQYAVMLESILALVGTQPAR